MDKRAKQFEDFLREFEPRRPRPLPATSAVPKTSRVAAGIVVAALCIGSLWILSRRPSATTETGAIFQPQTAPVEESLFSPRELTRLAMEDPEKFEAALTAASRRILPRFDANDSALRVLAEE